MALSLHGEQEQQVGRKLLSQMMTSRGCSHWEARPVLNISYVLYVLVLQEVVGSIVGCYSARVQRMAASDMWAELDKDTIFDALADAITPGAAVQVAELMTETGMY